MRVKHQLIPQMTGHQRIFRVAVFTLTTVLAICSQPRDLVQSVQFSSVTQSSPTLCDSMDCSMPGFPVYHQLLELTQTHVHRVSDAIQPSHLLLSPSPAFNLPASGPFPVSQSFEFRWSKYWSFSFRISPSNEYLGMISFRVNWFDLAVQGTRKSLLQHHNSKGSVG